MLAWAYLQLKNENKGHSAVTVQRCNEKIVETEEEEEEEEEELSNTFILKT
jgi:hypothetical protein